MLKFGVLRSLRRVFPVFVAAGTLLLASAGPAGSGEPVGDPLLLPDLITREPKGIYAQQGSSVWLVRFDNEVGNIDVGPVELVPTATGLDCGGGEEVSQRIYQDINGNGFFERGTDLGYVEEVAGCHVFHETHNHTHFEDFASYQLLSLPAKERVGSGEKISFCLADTSRSHSWVLGSPPPGDDSLYDWAGCNSGTQGISPGWSDQYSAGLDGQWVVTKPADGEYVGDGRYCLVSEADPEYRLMEVSNGNNAASVKIRLSHNGRRATRIKGTHCGGVHDEPW